MKIPFTEPVSEFIEINAVDIICASCKRDLGCLGDGAGSSDCPDNSGCLD